MNRRSSSTPEFGRPQRLLWREPLDLTDAFGDMETRVPTWEVEGLDDPTEEFLREQGVHSGGGTKRLPVEFDSTTKRNTAWHLDIEGTLPPARMRTTRPNPPAAQSVSGAPSLLVSSATALLIVALGAAGMLLAAS